MSPHPHHPNQHKPDVAGGKDSGVDTVAGVPGEEENSQEMDQEGGSLPSKLGSMNTRVYSAETPATHSRTKNVSITDSV